MNDSNDIERTRDSATKVFVMGLSARDDDHSHAVYDIFAGRVVDPAAGAVRMNC